MMKQPRLLLLDYGIVTLLILVLLLLAFQVSDGKQGVETTEIIAMTEHDLVHLRSHRQLLPSRRNQREAMLAWARALTERDYDNTYWPEIAGERSGPPQYFDLYIQKLSQIFAAKGANVNFVMIGACDGTNDLTIKRYISFKHWNGIFVEPVSINFDSLQGFLKTNGVEERSFALRAAATDLCSSPTIKIQRPLYEEQGMKEGKDVPHWLRRQIGGILPPDKTGAKPDWTLEEVKCVTARDMMSEWAQHSTDNTNAGFRRRPHVLKLDVEGHDYEVLMGFIMETTPVSELPLLISFEAKSLGEVKFKLAQARMISLGYAVARYANDGFALLRGDRMFQKKDGGSSSRSDGGRGGEDSSSTTIESSAVVREQQLPREIAAVEKIDSVMTDTGPEEDQEPL